MQYYKSKLPAPDYGFSPDAEFPVINIEKGGLGLLLTGCAEGGGEFPIVSMHAGERANVVPGAATATLSTAGQGFAELKARADAAATAHGFALTCEMGPGETAVLTATGSPAHASMPELGKNAAGMLLIALKEMKAGGPLYKAISALADKLGLAHDGENLGIKISDEESGALTCNLGLLRGDKNRITAQLDIRYPLSADEERMCGRAALALSGTGISLSKLSSHPPHHVPKEHKVVKGLLKVYAETTGLPGYAFSIGGGTYSRTMPNTVAFGFNFPGDTDTCHMPDEYVDIEKLMLSVKIFARAIAELAGGGN
jgi:succinyl-diaminopimelate desuccinylase